MSVGVYIHKKRDNSITKCRHLSLDRRVLFHKIFTKGTKGLFDGAESAMLKVCIRLVAFHLSFHGMNWMRTWKFCIVLSVSTKVVSVL